MPTWTPQDGDLCLSCQSRSLPFFLQAPSFMKLLLLVLPLALFLGQVSPVMKCWGTSGRCRATCKESEIFHILCKSEEKCCVNPKYVPVKPASTSLAKIPLQP
nr:beta-defensin 121-like isoform X1 [Oryctolagus cuniculus]